jgi:bacteriophage N4 adsorption protein B
MALEHQAAWCLIPVAFWILLSGLDDLFISLVYFTTRKKQFPWPAEADLEAVSERRIAIFVPLWHEHRVIGQMLEHNLSVIRYSNYDFFVGVYPNDPLTERAVAEAAQRHPRVHLAVCGHDGPTSKGDCLNWIHRSMEAFERRQRVRYDIILTHDAEDLAHPESLRLINWFSRDFDMVQVPVLALPTPGRDLTHGIYCDEFAEYQLKDIPARQQLGGFLPSNGVGTGFSRAALDELAADRGGRIFDPACLTEDYENGLRLHQLGRPQLFLPIRWDGAGPIATREYFPRTLGAAVRQRSRWVAGIALQGWQHHGWRMPARQLYWLWRDRKGLIGNLLSPTANLILAYGAGAWAAGRPQLFDHLPAGLRWSCAAMGCLSVLQISVRIHCCARVYGWRMAAWAPLRALWANHVNGVATIIALAQFFKARLRRSAMAWRKTDHVYPGRHSAVHGRTKIGEVLIQMRCVSREEVDEALRHIPNGLRLGEYLVRSRKLSEEQLYEALSSHAGIPLGRPGARDVSRLATRTLPAESVRRWRVLPYRVAMGQLHVLTTDVPTEEMSRHLAALSGLEIRFRLVRPRDFNRMAAEYLGQAV